MKLKALMNISLMAVALLLDAVVAAPRSKTPEEMRQEKFRQREIKIERLKDQWHTLKPGTARSTQIRYGQAIIRLKPGKKLARNKGDLTRNISSEAALVEWTAEDSTFSQFKSRSILAPEIADIEPNIKVQSEALSSHGRRISNRQLHQDRLTLAKKSLEKWRAKSGPSKKRKVRVAIFDTGIDGTHLALAGQVGAGYNSFNRFPLESMDSLELSDTTTMDYQGHGTLVSGVIAAKEMDDGMEGIAEDVSLYAVKVLNADGIGTLANVLDGLEWAIAQKVDIINMSIGCSDDSPLLHEAIRKATAKGILVVAATGNQFAPAMAYPAAYPEVVSVGSISRYGWISRFSNFSPLTSIYAPGEEITSTNRGLNDHESYRAFSGTSASAAYVTGYIGLLMSNGFPGAKALKLITNTAIERVSDMNPFDYPVKEMNEKFVLGAIDQPDSQQIAIKRFDVTPDYGNEQIKIEVELVNTSTQTSPAIPFQIDLEGEKGKLAFGLGSLKALAPMGGSVLKVSLPYNDSLRSISRPNEDYSFLKVRVSGSGRVVPGMDEQRFHWVSKTANEPHDIEIVAVWEKIESANGQERPTGLNVKVRNTGRNPIERLDLGFTIWKGVHEAVESAPAAQIFEPRPMGSIAPGEMRVLSLPWRPIDSLNIYTIQAEVTPDKGRQAKYMRAVSRTKDGVFIPNYSEELHMDIVRQAVALLKLHKIVIPDITEGIGNFFDVAGYHTWPDIPTAGFSIDNNIPVGSYMTESIMNTYWGITNFSMVAAATDCDGFDLLNNENGYNTWNSHYWLVDKGDYGTGHETFGVGSTSTQGALNKIEKIMYGNPGSNWLNHGVIDHYNNGYKSAAWYMMGHILHLIGDISLGSHVNDANDHGMWGDVYHNWMDAGNYTPYTAQTAFDNGGFIDPFQSASAGNPVRFLAYTTAQVGNSFPRFYTSPLAVYHAGVSGNRGFGNSSTPHYDAYMNKVWSQMPRRPLSTRDIASDEVWDYSPNFCFWCDAECQHVDWVGVNETRADCNNDGHKDFDNTDTPDGVPTNHDGDIAANASFAYPYAIRAAAGMIYYFAVITGQYTPPVLPPQTDPGLSNFPVISGFGKAVGTESRTNLSGAGYPGEKMIIYGYNFSSTGSENEVRFNGQLGKSVTFSNLSGGGANYGYLTVTIPDNAFTGIVTVIVKNKRSATVNTYQIAPRVTSIEPNTGLPGSSVTIYGQNLMNNTVSFTDANSQEVPATITEIDMNHIKVQVPVGKNIVNGLRLNWSNQYLNTKSFRIKPVITSLAPLHGKAGDPMVCYGEELKLPDETVTLTFAGNVNAWLSMAERFQLRGAIPAGVKTGPVTITVSAFNGKVVTTSDPVDFTVDPVVTSVSPASAEPGASVVVTGMNFVPGTGLNRLWFGDKEATITAMTETQLTAKVPVDGQTGPVKDQTLGIDATGGLFTYVPVLASLSKAKAFAGQTLVLTGNYFVNPVSQNQVWFGSQSATVVSGTATSLTVKIPGGAGMVSVKVAVNGVNSASIPFTYNTLVPIISLLLN